MYRFKKINILIKIVRECFISYDFLKKINIVDYLHLTELKL